MFRLCKQPVASWTSFHHNFKNKVHSCYAQYARVVYQALIFGLHCCNINSLTLTEYSYIDFMFVLYCIVFMFLFYFHFFRFYSISTCCQGTEQEEKARVWFEGTAIRQQTVLYFSLGSYLKRSCLLLTSTLKSFYLISDTKPPLCCLVKTIKNRGNSYCLSTGTCYQEKLYQPQ